MGLGVRPRDMSLHDPAAAPDMSGRGSDRAPQIPGAGEPGSHRSERKAERCWFACHSVRLTRRSQALAAPPTSTTMTAVANTSSPHP